MTTKKASDVLDKLISAVTNSSTVRPRDGKPVASAALRKDLMELLPEKVSNHTRSYGDGWNEAIDQMEQAIKQYFGQEDV